MPSPFDVAVFIVISFLILSLSPIVNSIETKAIEFNSSEKVIEINLLRGEHYLYINATENVDSFKIKYVFPAELDYQYPIIIEILNDTTADILDYIIKNDTNNVNLINFVSNNAL